MIDDAVGEVAATTVIAGVHLDATVRRAIRLPQDVRERAMQMRQEDLASLLQTVG